MFAIDGKCFFFISECHLLIFIVESITLAGGLSIVTFGKQFLLVQSIKTSTHVE